MLTSRCAVSQRKSSASQRIHLSTWVRTTGQHRIAAKNRYTASGKVAYVQTMCDSELWIRNDVS